MGNGLSSTLMARLQLLMTTYSLDLPVADALTEVLRRGAKELLAQAVEAEVAEAIAQFAELTGAQGRRRVVRNGYLPERAIQTGIGEVTVKAPRVRDRGGELKFSSSLMPP